MSDFPAIDPDVYLARLAALDMAAAERAHAKFMAAEETRDVTELGRTYQRAARSLRQTLTIYARFRDGVAAPRARDAAVLPQRPAWSPPAHLMARIPPDNPGEQEVIDALDAAVQARIRAEYDPSEVEALDNEIHEAFDDLLDDDFLARPLADQTDAVMAWLRATRAPAARVPAARPAADPQTTAAPEPTPDLDTQPDPESRPEPGSEGEPEPAGAAADPPDACAPSLSPDPQPPPDPAPEPYVPPWERLRPGQIFPGGSGW